MERQMLLQISGLVCGTLYLTTAYDTSLAFTKPWLSAIILYFVAGVALLLVHRFRTLDAPTALSNAGSQANRHTYLTIPGDERLSKPYSSPRRTPLHSRHGSGDSGIAFITGPESRKPQWRWRIAFALLVFSLCLRVPVTVAWIRHVECSALSVAAFLPLLLALYDLKDFPNLELWLEKVDDRLVRRVESRAQRWINDSRYTYILAMLTLAGSGAVMFVVSSGVTSTYICLPGSHGAALALLYQCLGLILDALAIICSKELLVHQASSRQATRDSRGIGFASLASAALLLLVGMLICLCKPALRSWTANITTAYLLEAIKMALIATFMVLCAVSLNSKLSVQQCFTVAVFSAVFVSSWPGALIRPQAKEFSSERIEVPAFAMAVASFLFAVQSWSSTANAMTVTTVKRTTERKRQLFIGLGTLLLCIRLAYSILRSESFQVHPIDMLIADARTRHEVWGQNNIDKTGTLHDAVTGYRSRYGRPPPPNFDKWYAFATQRNSLIINNFDNIYNDLLPFWSVSPAVLRQVTAGDLAQRDNGMGGIKIRKHKATVHPDVPESHAWMLEAAVNMTLPFIEHLPDMDVPFNMNDESRVMLPYEDRLVTMLRAKLAVRSPAAKPRNSFSDAKSSRWPEISSDSMEPYRPSPPFQPIFESHGIAHCAPGARAKLQAQWQLQTLCTSCMTVASRRAEAKDPTTIEPCQQPDLAHLHGFYASPSTFRPTSELRPTFSQSKAPGFLDIRYPNPWNYAELVKYAPDTAHPDVDFTEKEGTLFWRGTTTEGFASADGRHAWQGMTRQRFVNAMNFPDSQSVLLPRSSASTSSWKSRSLTPQTLYMMLDTEVAVTGPIARCMHTDCSDQVELFNRTNPYEPESASHRALTTNATNFQDHWQYKYLFDMDGAGLSGRFIPFLRSKSLVVKTTSLFSEWWDGRIQPWWHYVPVDLRLTGLHSTLAYFIGLKPGSVRGVDWTGRADQAEMLATNGRQWAEKVLRKEDMEIYMFRLLLEWGRLVDDDRDVIGFEIQAR